MLFGGSPVTKKMGFSFRIRYWTSTLGNACGWMCLDDLIAAMEMAGTYLNVHTLSNLPGEVRGQLQ